jgi:hypothetical protein
VPGWESASHSALPIAHRCRDRNICRTSKMLISTFKSRAAVMYSYALNLDQIIEAISTLIRVGC